MSKTLSLDKNTKVRIQGRKSEYTAVNCRIRGSSYIGPEKGYGQIIINSSAGSNFSYTLTRGSMQPVWHENRLWLDWKKGVW